MWNTYWLNVHQYFLVIFPRTTRQYRRLLLGIVHYSDLSASNVCDSAVHCIALSSAKNDMNGVAASEWKLSSAYNVDLTWAKLPNSSATGRQACSVSNSEKNKIDMGISRSISCPLTNKAIGRWNAKTTCFPAQRINKSRFMHASDIRRRFHIEFITNACWCLDRWFVINLLIVRCAQLKYTQLDTEMERCRGREIDFTLCALCDLSAFVCAPAIHVCVYAIWRWIETCGDDGCCHYSHYYSRKFWETHANACKQNWREQKRKTIKIQQITGKIYFWLRRKKQRKKVNK